MSAEVRTMFDRIAPTYDALNRTLSLGIDGLWRKRAVAALGDLAGVRVLDLCAGTLDLSVLIGRRFPTARVVAADFAREMLLCAGGKRARVRATIAPVVADAHHLPFAGGVFGAALCAFGMRNLDDPAAGLAEVRRVLAPGARLAVLEFFRPDTGGRRLLHRVYNRNVLPAVGGLVSGDAGAYRYLAASMEGFLARAEFEGIARAAGFEVARSEPLFPGVASLVVCAC